MKESRGFACGQITAESRRKIIEARWIGKATRSRNWWKPIWCRGRMFRCTIIDSPAVPPELLTRRCWWWTRLEEVSFSLLRKINSFVTFLHFTSISTQANHIPLHGLLRLKIYIRSIICSGQQLTKLRNQGWDRASFSRNLREWVHWADLWHALFHKWLRKYHRPE